MARKEIDHWKEYEAKYILEDIFPNLGILNKSECPDIHGNSIGIEVTEALEENWQRSQSHLEKYLLYGNEKDRERVSYTTDKIDGYHAEYHECGVNGIKMWSGSMDNTFAMNEMLLLRAIDEKCKKLNDGHYTSFPAYGLFVRSMINLDTEVDKNRIIADIQKVFIEYKEQILYDVIYIFSISLSKMYVIDTKTWIINDYEVDSAKYSKKYDSLR